MLQGLPPTPESSVYSRGRECFHVLVRNAPADAPCCETGDQPCCGSAESKRATANGHAGPDESADKIVVVSRQYMIMWAKWAFVIRIAYMLKPDESADKIVVVSRQYMIMWAEGHFSSALYASLKIPPLCSH